MGGQKVWRQSLDIFHFDIENLNEDMKLSEQLMHIFTQHLRMM